MRQRIISKAEAAQWRRDIISAPILDVAKGAERTFTVRRVGFLPPMYNPEAAYFQTVAGKIWRLPSELEPWAVDVVALALADMHDPFPRRITFGREAGGIAFDSGAGRIWARFDD